MHPLEHHDEHGAFVHLDGDPHGHPDKSELCDALAALTACASSSVWYAGIAPLEAQPISARPQGLRVAEPPPFLAQGPPQSL